MNRRESSLPLMALAMAALASDIRSAGQRKIDAGDTRPFPVTKDEMVKIRKAVEKRKRKAAKWQAEASHE